MFFNIHALIGPTWHALEIQPSPPSEKLMLVEFKSYFGLVNLGPVIFLVNNLSLRL